MTDLTLDALLEAVRKLVGIVYELDKSGRLDGELLDMQEKLDALIAQRTGRPDDEPATK